MPLHTFKPRPVLPGVLFQVQCPEDECERALDTTISELVMIVVVEFRLIEPASVHNYNTGVMQIDLIYLPSMDGHIWLYSQEQTNSKVIVLVSSARVGYHLSEIMHTFPIQYMFSDVLPQTYRAAGV
jgi:hypothetical protein